MQKTCVILQTAFLGDVLLSIPLLKRLKALGYQSHYICREGLEEFLVNTKLVHKCYSVKKGDKKSYQSVLQTLPEVDALFCIHQSLRSLLFSRKIKAKTKIGFKSVFGSLIFDLSVSRNMSLPDALRQLSLMTVLDAETQKIVEAASPITFRKANVSAALQDIISKSSMQVSSQGLPSSLKSLTSPPYICISPGSRWLTKRWGVDGFVAVAKELESKGFQIVGVGASDELDVCRQILDKTKGGVNLAGQLNLTQLHGVLEKARLLISNDSGAMHMASVAGTPCVSVFGPTTPEMGYRPWNPNSIIVQNEDLKCRPCGKHGHMKCPIGTHECMISIRPEQVISASHQLLQQTKALSH